MRSSDIFLPYLPQGRQRSSANVGKSAGVRIKRWKSSSFSHLKSPECQNGLIELLIVARLHSVDGGSQQGSTVHLGWQWGARLWLGPLFFSCGSAGQLARRSCCKSVMTFQALCCSISQTRIPSGPPSLLEHLNVGLKGSTTEASMLRGTFVLH